MSPIYDMKCPTCDRKEEDVFLHSHKDEHKCKRCRTPMKRLFTQRKVSGHVFPADGIFLEHVSATGKRFHSKREMRDFEKKTGTTIGMLH